MARAKEKRRPVGAVKCPAGEEEAAGQRGSVIDVADDTRQPFLQFQKFVDSELVRWGGVIRSANIKADGAPRQMRRQQVARRR